MIKARKEINLIRNLMLKIILQIFKQLLKIDKSNNFKII